MKRLRIISTFLLVTALLVTSVQPVSVFADEPVDEVGYADPEEPVSVDNMGENVENEETGTEEGLAEETLTEAGDAAAGPEEEPVTEPVAEPVTEPVVEPVAEPVTEFSPESHEEQETETASGADADKTGTDADKIGTDTAANNADTKEPAETSASEKVEEEQTDPDTITAIDSPDQTELHFEYKLALDSLLEELPHTITVYRGEDSQTIEANWVCDGDYDDSLGEYSFIPDMEGYILADDLELPRLIVTFDDEVGGEVGGLIENTLGYDVPVLTYGRRRASAEALPAKYNNYTNGGLTEVKSQGQTGTCWAHATIGSIEADLLKDGTMSAPDLSELHLAYYMFHGYNDPKGCRTVNITQNSSAPDAYLQNGGNSEAAAKLLSNLVGAVSEDEVPFSTGTGFSPDDSYLVSKDCVQIRNAYFINIDDRDGIKSAIMQHGGVSASYRETKSKNEFLSSTNSYYYATPTESTNHAIMLVGWDDSFPASDFAQTPEGNGAWLVRNSWGLDGYGHNGYFWMSYYDKSLNNVPGSYNTKYAVAFDAVTDKYDNCYAYDGCVIGDYTLPVGSSYTVKETYNVSAGEVIRGVAFEIGTANVQADITVKNKDTGETVSTGIHTSFAGIYTAELEYGLEIEEDAEIEVSVNYTSDNGDEVLIVGEINEGYPYNYFTVSGVKDKGFILDMGYYSHDYDFDPRMKLYTNNTGASTDPDDHSVKGVTLDRINATLGIGKELTLTPTVFPKRADDKSVTWSTSDESIATVTQEGVVRGVAEGTADITVTTNDGGWTATCTVNVEPVHVTRIGMSYTSRIYVGSTYTFTATIYPEDATDKTVTWSSSDENVATVSEKGVVKGISPGTATITATSNDGNKKASVTVTIVSIAVSSVYISGASTVYIGDPITLTATVYPSNASDKRVTWNSSDETIATVSEDGVVTGIKAGSVSITVTTVDGGKTATRNLTVKPAEVTGVVLDKQTAEVFAGDTITIKETVSPENAGDKTVTWSSSDTTVATVSDKGVVTGIKPGEATITVKTNNKGKTATCKVTVKPVAVTGVVITPATQEVFAGRTLTLTPVISPGNATDKAVTWTSSDTAIATVTDAGVVKGVAPGEATVTVTTKDGAKKATCKITVKPVAVTGLALDRTTGSVSVGNTLTLKATVSPSDATEKGISWESDTPAVATVTEAGVVKGISAGTANITATTVDGGKIATCKVTVNPVKVSSIKLNTTAGEVVVGKTFTLSATVSPSNASNKELSWKSSDTSVATVVNGVVKGVKAGTVTITCSSTDGSNKAATCKVTVKAIAVTGVKLNKTSVSIFMGRTYTLTPTISPSDATNKKVKWKSSDTSVATVGSDGVVTGIKAGKATITCTAADGSKKSATCTVTVKTPVSSIKLNKTSVGIFKGKTYTLTATVSPSNATKKTVTWSSSDTSIATVTADGVVKGVKAGKATITCTAADGSKVSSTCKVTVKIPVSAISLNKTSVKINKGKTYTLTPTISPSSASNKNVTWTSSNTKIATVSADGVVKGLRAGTATITCTAADGTKKSATCNVTVKIPVTGVTLNKSKVSVSKGKTVTLTATVEPSNATTKTVTWSSSNTGVATVSSSGVVKGIKKGTATITVTTKDGKKTATCRVTVK